MKPYKNDSEQQSRHQHSLPQEIDNTERRQAIKAHEEAEKDMEEDAELTAHNPNDDLDEEETVKKGDNETELV